MRVASWCSWFAGAPHQGGRAAPCGKPVSSSAGVLLPTSLSNAPGPLTAQPRPHILPDLCFSSPSTSRPSCVPQILPSNTLPSLLCSTTIFVQTNFTFHGAVSPGAVPLPGKALHSCPSHAPPLSHGTFNQRPELVMPEASTWHECGECAAAPVPCPAPWLRVMKGLWALPCMVPVSAVLLGVALPFSLLTFSS